MRTIQYLLLFLTASYLAAQSTDIPLGSAAYPTLDEWDAKSEMGFFTGVKPISRRYIADFYAHAPKSLSNADAFDKSAIYLQTRHYLEDSLQKNSGLFNRFFKLPTDFLAVHTEDFQLHVDPIWVFGGGRESASDELIYQNYRGLQLWGTIDDKVSFYALLNENQARYPTYVRNMTDSTIAIPFEGFWKQYQETGVDFLRAQAYIDFNATKHISAQFGYGKHFIGNGIRSLVLSDVGNNYPYLRLNTRVWKIQYTNIFAQLVGETYGGDFGLLGVGSFPKKYLATHRLSIKPTPNLTLSLFESVIYGDSTNSFKVEYMNPLIFYLALEQQDGSADNVLIGLDFKWNLFKRISLYGQLLIDELIVGEAFSDSGWWGNKVGLQAGIQYFDAFGIDNLDMQVEFNRVRPYTYSHEDNYGSYTHYNMALAHPLGANFEEMLLSGSYRPLDRLKISGTLLMARYGDDIGTASFGRDPLKSYNARLEDYGVNIGQGVLTNLHLFRANATYMIYHNLAVEAGFTYRKEHAEGADPEITKIGTLGLRWNFPARSYLF
ncbi:capsule assembly Wzi family protein [Marinoscillum furvescens]|uniref:Capsule assembly protein Wzi n=1 Tax=Marinoscillum furvescens DSM 4134 TaxID=1122208 RepID=A0A3D9L3S8_MARFU|nr:capsule assembly Wzi family protein [Marinoscillum furvescens]RED98920.1 capsule assembly protein Wzi [Marinoscillum furvescens DSM 4134]